MEQSAAVVTNVATEVKGGLGELFLVLEAPLSDSHLWACGAPVTIEATWSHKYILYPTHKDLTVILDQCSVKGPFLVDEVNTGECLEVYVRVCWGPDTAGVTAMMRPFKDVQDAGWLLITAMPVGA